MLRLWRGGSCLHSTALLRGGLRCSSTNMAQQDEGGSVHIRRHSDGYLHKILQARVYDVCIETKLQHAPVLSGRYRNQIYLKREDTQPVTK